MKNLCASFFLLVLAACASSGGKETASQDSLTAANDTTIADIAREDETIGEVEEESSEEMRDTSQLEITFDETAGLVFDRNELFYTVTITTSQYEASSDVTWYFDKDISPIYFKETWSAEGNEGSTEFFIEGGDVICASSQESTDEIKWCRSTGGIRIFDGGSGDLLKELTPAEYGTDCNTELTRYLGILKSILSEGDQTAEDETSYSFIIAKTSEIGGQEVHESTEITIPKKVYNELMGK